MRSIYCVILLWCVIVTAQRNYVWNTPETLWRDSVAKSPMKERPRHALGGALLMEGRFEQSLSADLEAIALLPNAHSEFYQRAGTALLKLKRWDEAHAMFIRAVDRDHSSQSWQNLGASYLQRYFTVTPYEKRREWLWLAQEAYSRSIAADLSNEWAVDGFVDASFYASTDLANSMQQYLWEVRRPLDYEEVYALAKIALNAGFYEQAEALFSGMHQTGRRSLVEHLFHGYALEKLKQNERAKAEYTLALRMDPMFPQLRESIAQLQ